MRIKRGMFVLLAAGKAGPPSGDSFYGNQKMISAILWQKETRKTGLLFLFLRKYVRISVNNTDIFYLWLKEFFIHRAEKNLTLKGLN